MNLEAFSESANGEIVTESNRRHGTYVAFVPFDLPSSVDLSSRLIMLLSEADRAVGELASESRHLQNPGLLVDPLQRREAVLSVRIEGTRTFVSDLYAYDAAQLSLFGDDSSGQIEAMREAQSYEEALRRGISIIEDDPDRPVSMALLCDLHSILMPGSRLIDRVKPGEIRDDQNWIGPTDFLTDATYVGPPPSQLRVRLQTFERHMNSYVVIPPLIRLAQLHYQFEALHPFSDGNGRLGRLLLSLLLAKWRVLPKPVLYVSGYLEAHREEYYRHLQGVTERGDWYSWFWFFLEGVRSETVDTLKRIDRFQQLHARYVQLAAAESNSANLQSIVNMLFELPLVSAPRISARLGISQPAARGHIKRLEVLGVLEKFPVARRAHWYVAREILDTIEA